MRVKRYTSRMLDTILTLGTLNSGTYENFVSAFFVLMGVKTGAINFY